MRGQTSPLLHLCFSFLPRTSSLAAFAFATTIQYLRKPHHAVSLPNFKHPVTAINDGVIVSGLCASVNGAIDIVFYPSSDAQLEVVVSFHSIGVVGNSNSDMSGDA
eukprot:scaffold1486_cov186-Alexandrium_tamarense.AAC.9